jgi:hypothetical protein
VAMDAKKEELLRWDRSSQCTWNLLAFLDWEHHNIEVCVWSVVILPYSIIWFSTHTSYDIIVHGIIISGCFCTSWYL